jgi:hypothetical protein
MKTQPMLKKSCLPRLVQICASISYYKTLVKFSYAFKRQPTMYSTKFSTTKFSTTIFSTIFRVAFTKIEILKS